MGCTRVGRSECIGSLTDIISHTKSKIKSDTNLFVHNPDHMPRT
jgi:hypothetical protein